MSNLFINQQVQVLIIAPHNHFQPSVDTLYHVGAINRVQGQYVAQLIKDNVCVGAIPENKLKAK